MNKSKICVVGSCNYDMIAYTDRLPKQGETIHGNDFKMGFGGKGANQAVAAAKLGADVVMVGKLGNDIFGKQTIENFNNLKIDTTYLHFTDKASSGVAPIWVDKDGHNSIIVVAGANNLLKEEEIEKARSAISFSSILICQNEVPLSVTKKALKLAREEGVSTLFNPAPAPDPKLLDNEFFGLIDIFCPNETETELLTGVQVKSIDDAVKAGKILISKGVKKIIMTLGGRGSLLITKDGFEHIKGYEVKPLDTTGAGDCFIGSYAYFSSIGLDDKEAIKRANYVASISVQRAGTQTSFPSSQELPKELFS